jgi:tetratricopeptide (TPR) repeat protein
VDLSDEWEAMVQEVAEPAATATVPKEVAPAPEPAPTEAAAEEERIEIEVPSDEVAPIEVAPIEAAIEIPEATIVPEAIEIIEPAELPIEVVEEGATEPSIEIIEETAEEAPAVEAAPAANIEFELELTPEPTGTNGKNGAATTEDFLSELASEIEDMETPSPAPKAPAKAPVEPMPVAAASAPPAASAPIPETTAESLNELAEVFQEFRSELGEMEDEDEDLETHYNLGIAYREMGLLDEAIGEFQKVAKAVQKGKPFRYSMNCATLLALSFTDKGEPKIAALWYQRALDVPGLDQEAILALRYDLAMALDMAGEANAALDSFRQVYAMNIDYRDVADRIATLQKH